MIICVTGKAGSGKTTVSRILKSAIKSSKIIDADIIDADILGKKLLSDSEIKKKLVIVFDNKILLKRKISRRKLAETAFSSTKNQKMLNSIVHPDIIKKIKSSAKSRKGIIKTTTYKKILFITNYPPNYWWYCTVNLREYAIFFFRNCWKWQETEVII